MFFSNNKPSALDIEKTRFSVEAPEGYTTPHGRPHPSRFPAFVVYRVFKKPYHILESFSSKSFWFGFIPRKFKGLTANAADPYPDPWARLDLAWLCWARLGWQKSHILALFEFSKHRQRKTTQSNQGDGRKSQTALGYSISGARFCRKGLPKGFNKRARNRIY